MSDYQGNIVIKNPATPAGPFENGAAPGVWKLSEVLPFVRQGIWPTQGVQAPDTFFRNVSLLLSTTSLGNANNNLFVDSSGAFNPVSRNGNTTQGSATPYSASWSNFFDGSGDYFTVPYTAANFDWYTAGVDFTIEYWFFANSLTGTSYVDGGTTKSTVVGNRSATNTTDYWSFGPNAGGTVTFYYFNGGPVSVTSTATVTANTWNHIAMTKTSSGITIFVNGVAQTTTAISGTPQSSASFPITVGQGNNTSYNGYVSNLRIVRGTAIYSGNFTVPTAPLTAVTNTKLLTCQSNRFRDASTNNLTLTVTGNTSVTEFSPFAPGLPGIVYNQSDITNWSGYLNGSSYWTIPTSTALDVWDNGSGSFTVEAWIYATASIGNNVSIVAKAPNNGSPSWSPGWAFQVFNGYLNVNTPSDTRLFNSNTTSVPLNQWVHCVLVKSGSTVSIYQNGTRVGTTTNSTAYSNTTDAVAIGVDRNFAGSKLTGYVSNVRMVKGTAVYDPTQSTITVPTTNLTAVNGTSLLTLQSAAFTDNSGNNYLVNSTGSSTVTGNSPFNTVGYWSNYFDGSGDYLTAPNNAALQPGSSDFTYEAWIYPTGAPNAYHSVFSKRSTTAGYAGVFVGIKSNGKFSFLVSSNSSTWGFVDESSASFTLNTWQHFAAVRSGSSLFFYVNGVRVISSSIGFSVYDDGAAQAIGDGAAAGGQSFLGYISNARIVKGTAVYTGASFTVPTSPLTAITNTSLLTCQNGRFIDNSTNAFAITVNGNTSVQSFDPFYTSTIASNGGSMYFDGTGDHLAIPSAPIFNIGAADASVEMWVYSFNTNNVSLNGQNGGSNSTIRLLQYGGFYAFTINNDTVRSTSVAITPNCWAHLVVTITGGIARLFVNGVLQFYGTGFGSVAARTDIYYIGGEEGIADWLTGYIADFRFNNGVIPTAYQTSSTSTGTAVFTPPTTPLTPTANTVLLVNGMNAGAYDATAINDMETVGNAQVSTVQSKFGGSSLYFDGSTSNRVKPPASALFAFGTGNFTVEAWVYVTNMTTENFVFDTRSSSSTAGMGFSLEPNTGKLRYSGNANNVLTSTAVSANTWTHVAWVRNGSTLTGYINGVSGGTASNSDNLTQTNGEVGNVPFSAVGTNMYIDDLRVTKGVARYTANFTPPTQAFPVY
jgi:hypothetical protein